MGGNLYFVADVAGSIGEELFKSDGTVSGTTLLKDINLGSADSNMTYLTATDSKIFFRAYHSFIWV